MDYFVRYRVGLLVALLGYLTLIFLVPSTASAETFPYELQRVYNRDGSYAYTTYTLKNNTIAGGTKYLAKNVPVSLGSLGALGRSALKWAGPAGLIIGALLDEFGVVRSADPVTGDINLTPWYSTYGYGTTAGYFFYNQNDFSCLALGGGRCLGESVGAIATYIAQNGVVEHCRVSASVASITGNGTPTSGIYPSYDVTWNFTTSGSWNGTTCTGSGSSGTATRTVYRRSISSPFSGTNTYVDGLVDAPTVTDSELGHYLLNSEYQMSTTEIADMLREAVSAAYWNPAWSEMVDAVTATEGELNPDSEAYDETKAGNTVSDQPITVTGTTTGTGSMEIEFPGFCEWAGVVCTFIDWVTAPPEEPEEVELPIQEMEMPDEITVGGGSYACPAPITFDALGTNMAYEWDAVCGVSDSIEPIMIVMASILAVIILLGVVV